MKTIERVMRVMTHMNIGATLGLATWLAWSGLQVVGGEWKVPHPARPVAAKAAVGGDRAENWPCCFRRARANEGLPAPSVAALEARR